MNVKYDGIPVDMPIRDEVEKETPCYIAWWAPRFKTIMLESVEERIADLADMQPSNIFMLLAQEDVDPSQLITSAAEGVVLKSGV